MYRIFLLSIILALSCTQPESNATIATILEMSNALDENNKHLIKDTEDIIDEMRTLIKRRTDYKPLLKHAERIKETTLKFTTYIDSLDLQLYRTCQTKPIRINFDDLSLKKLKNRSLAKNFLNKPKEGTAQTTLQNIIVSTLSTKAKMQMVLAGLRNNRELGITKKEVDILSSLVFTFAIDTVQANGKTRLQNAFEGKSVASCHAALILLKNETLSGYKETVNYLFSKIGHTSTIFYRPSILSSPSKHRFKKGSTFETEIFLSHLLRYEAVRIEVNGDSIPLKDEVGVYKTRLPKNGKLTYKTKVSAINPFTGRKEEVSRTFSYE